ncbi:MAG: citrate/2-methylcitrate synthase, partial [Myxococcota bacterium]
MASDSLTITDNRTGQTYEVPVSNGTISAMDLRQIKTSDDDFGLMSYDPAYKNTASTKSRITFIDGENGILRYRGYPIEQLAEQASFLEVSYLLYYGELPSKSELKEYQHEITHHTMVHENVRELVDAFRYDAHPMGILASMYAALSTFYPDAKNVRDAEVRKLQMHRLIAKTPTLAAYAYRHRRGLPYVYPDNDLSYAGNFLNMLFKMTEVKYQPNPIIEKALDVLFILHADHEQNCSASAMRSVGSSETDPFSATAAACAALYGPLHGGANEAVVRMLTEIGSVSNIKDYVAKAKGGEVRLMGFGHRVYKNYDPRAKVIKKLAYQVFDEVGKNPLIDIAVELEKIALEDEYFVKR